MICQYCNKKGHTAPQCFRITFPNNEKPPTCYICNKEGHIAKNCRFQPSNNDKNKNWNETPTCQIYNKKGHTSISCWNAQNNTGPKPDQLSNRSFLNFQICRKPGHTAATCKRTPYDSSKYCELCNRVGHSYEQCMSKNFPQRPSGNEYNPPRTSALREVTVATTLHSLETESSDQTSLQFTK